MTILYNVLYKLYGHNLDCKNENENYKNRHKFIIISKNYIPYRYRFLSTSINYKYR